MSLSDEEIKLLIKYSKHNEHVEKGISIKRQLIKAKSNVDANYEAAAFTSAFIVHPERKEELNKSGINDSIWGHEIIFSNLIDKNMIIAFDDDVFSLEDIDDNCPEKFVSAVII